MDISKPNKKKPRFKLYAVSFISIVAVFFVGKYLWFLGSADFSVNQNTIVSSEVKRGNFVVSVRGTGVLVPENIQWLSNNIDGRVEKLYAKAGNTVAKGDVIVELSNVQLVQQLAEAQWELDATEAEFKAKNISLESILLGQKSNVLNDQLGYESSLLKYDAESQLVNQATGVVSKITFERTSLETEQYKKRWKISQERLEKMKEDHQAQYEARSARAKKTRKVLERIQQQVDDLNIRASIDSVVLEIPIEEGQRVAIGSSIAKLAEQNRLIAELQIPELQISDVSVGQKVVIDTRNNKVEGTVTRVDPAVINGNVQVDVSFTEALPADARPDLSVDGEIEITQIEDTLYVDRPLFAQSRSNASFYRMDSNNQFAERTEVKVGWGSVNQIQIVDGLKEGDVIITSDPSQFESYNRFRIN